MTIAGPSGSMDSKNMASQIETHKDFLEHLFLEEDMKVKEIVQYMSKSYRLTANEGAYQRAFRKWGFKKNCKGSDYLWAKLKGEERSAQGKDTNFYFKGRKIDDQTIEKRHVSYWDLQTKRPTTPEGWTAQTPPFTYAPTVESSSSHVPIIEHILHRAADANGLEKIDHANGNSEHHGAVAEPAAPDRIDSGRSKIDSDAEVNANVRVALEHLYRNLRFHNRCFVDPDDDLGDLEIRLRRGDTYCPAHVLQEAMVMACEDGQSQYVAALLSRGVSPDLRHSDGVPCIMKAALNNFESLVQCLVANHANVNLTDRAGRTSWSRIHEEDEGDHEAVASILLQANPIKYVGGILDAAARGHVDEARSMIGRGADPSYFEPSVYKVHSELEQDDCRWTPLHWAAYKGNRELAHMLIENGAELDARSMHNWRPIDIAPEGTEVYQLFVAHGAIRSSIDTLVGYGSRLMTIKGRTLHPSALRGEGLARAQELRNADNVVHSMSTSIAHMQMDPQNRRLQSSSDNRMESIDAKCSPMSWQYTAIAAPEVLKRSPYRLSRFLGSSTRSTEISVDGSSYRSSHGQASLSLVAIIAKNSQGQQKSWATPPMRTPPW